jgi:hypothetical protein
MTLRTFHADFAWVVVGTNAAVGLWALAAYRDARFRSRWLWWSTIVAELCVLAQVGAGVALVSLQHHKVAGFHALYGFSAFATVGIIYSYRQQMPSREHLLYGLGGLFLMGLALRAIQVSPFPPH